MTTKVYGIHFDNGEPYEDHYSYTDKIFLSREAAEGYLDKHYQRVDEGNTDSKQYWKHIPRKCKRGETDALACDECNLYTDDNDDVCCRESYDLLDNMYDYSSYSIEEFTAYETSEDAE